MIDVYPIPNGVYDIRVNIIQPQPALVNNSDEILVPAEPVIMGAYARAIAERGEDAGLAGNEAYALYKQSLGDAISLESGLFCEEQEWSPV